MERGRSMVKDLEKEKTYLQVGRLKQVSLEFWAQKSYYCILNKVDFNQILYKRS